MTIRRVNLTQKYKEVMTDLIGQVTQFDWMPSDINPTMRAAMIDTLIVSLTEDMVATLVDISNKRDEVHTFVRECEEDIMKELEKKLQTEKENSTVQ